ncbi:transcription antitermination factor NusB [Oscillatoria amoena NRMC-F 0135]|nr:transcription antitermination factor NusB [Geitlerinema splendidum]MDL5044690.1 transcription antitermination factor NusB [Oscillatoria amoena NRMC-F 0135]
MLPRQIARELALLSLSQLPTTPEKLETQQLQDLMLAAVRTLRTEASEALETAAAELQRSSDRLLDSETIANSVPSARAMLKESIELAQLAINRVGSAMEIPELVYLSSNQQEVYEYALELTKLVHANRTEVDNILKQSLVNWQLDRIARIDRDILRIAVVEMLYVGIDEKVAINQAIEMAKRYSGNEEYRFINGVLRRVSNLLKSNLV